MSSHPMHTSFGKSDKETRRQRLNPHAQLKRQKVFLAMQLSLQERLSSQRKFKQTALTTHQLEILAKKLKIPDFVGVYSADHHPYIHNPTINQNTLGYGIPICQQKKELIGSE